MTTITRTQPQFSIKVPTNLLPRIQWLAIIISRGLTAPGTTSHLLDYGNTLGFPV